MNFSDCYHYSHFVDELIEFGKIEKRSDKVNYVIDYMASKAILDGTLSMNTIARMYKIKAQIALKFNKDELAIKYFEQALKYNDKVGVKRVLSALKKK